MSEYADTVIVGAGAAGLMAAIWAGRTHPDSRIVVLDGASKLGAKILVAGGGRCNVTHDEIDVQAYAGSSRNAIKKVLRRFDVPQTIDFFRELGVELKREATGKLFPTTNSAKTILETLLRAVDQPNISVRYPRRVQTIEREGEHFCIVSDWGQIEASTVILATGGKSLPKSGSDGQGYAIAQALGHRLTEHIFPALVPLLLPTNHFLCQLSGLTVPASIGLRSSSGKKLIAFTDSLLCTHFGLSGPAVLDFSRYYTDAQFSDPGVKVTINWLPEKNTEQVETELYAIGQTSKTVTPLTYIAGALPERLIRALCTQIGIEAWKAIARLSREQRKTLAQSLTALPLPIVGDRGYNYAEVTAGGIPLDEIYLDRMESRVCPGLYLCGEICDVDGRIGGYNFQWAWATGYVAGVSAGG